MMCFSAGEVVKRMHGRDLTVNYWDTNGFDVPLLVEKKDGLGLRVPAPSITVEDIEKRIGESKHTGRKVSGIYQNSGTVHNDFGQFLVWRHFVWIFSGILRHLVACSLTSNFLAEYDVVLWKQIDCYG